MSPLEPIATVALATVGLLGVLIATAAYFLHRLNQAERYLAEHRDEVHTAGE